MTNECFLFSNLKKQHQVDSKKGFPVRKHPGALGDWPTQREIQKHLPKPYAMHSRHHVCKTNLPLHAPDVKTANIEKLRSTGVIAEALSWIEGLASKTSLKKRQKTEARQEDIDTLERAGIIERCTKEQIVTTGSLFSESKKRRNGDARYTGRKL